MLSEDVPVRLRLIVAQATGADTAYPTLEDFSTALAYFERPDSNQVLKALFERAMAAPVRAAAEMPDASPWILPEEEVPGPVARSDAPAAGRWGGRHRRVCPCRLAWCLRRRLQPSGGRIRFVGRQWFFECFGCDCTGATESATVGTVGGTASDAPRGSARTPERPAGKADARIAAKTATAENAQPTAQPPRALTAATAKSLFMSRRCCR